MVQDSGSIINRMRAAINPNLFEIINKNKAFRVRTGKALKMVEF